MSLLISYAIRILPGLILLALLYFLFTKKESMLRIIILILAFIMMRDTMTPMGIWTFGQGQGIIWFRFINDSFVLLALALLSGVFSIIVLKFNRKKLVAVNWTAQSSYLLSLLHGCLGSLLTAGPFLILYLFIPIDLRGGLVSMDLWPALFIFCLLGNFLEEVLFRELLQEKLLHILGYKRAILASALFFAAGHVFLATSVSNMGALILIFTFWEGLICAYLYQNNGLLAATIAHGLTIFLLSSGIV